MGDTMQQYATFDTDGKPTGFYFPAIHGDKIPADAVTISDEDYQAYINEQGKWVRVDGERVAAPPPPPPTTEELLIGIRAERDRRLAVCDWRVLPDAPEAGSVGWGAYRQALRDFPAVCDVLAPAWPEV